MKMKLALIKNLGGFVRRGAAAATVLLSCGLPLHAHAASGSPVGTWDVVISGARQGLAVMQFSDGGTPDTRTFSVYEIVVPKRPSFSSSSSDDTRGTGGDDSRTGTSSVGSSSTTPTVISTTNLFGEETTLNGQWGFDVNGKLVGTYVETRAEVCTPVTFTVWSTNYFPDGSVGVSSNTITTNNCVGITNGVSFTGSAVPGKHLTLTGRAFSRPVVFSGIPVITLTNASGSYNGARVAGGESSIEFFTLSLSALDFGSNLIYDIHGAGAGYSYIGGGHALLSRRGKVAFAIPLDPDGNILRATVGGFSLRQLRFSTLGVEQPAGELQNFMRFNGGFVAP